MTLPDRAWQARWSLAARTDAAVRHAFHTIWASTPKPQEPDFVAALVLEASPILYQAVLAEIGGHATNSSLVAVFCHQSPKVTYVGATKSCELGDILFVHVHTDATGLTSRNALLYQVKMSSSNRHRVAKSEAHQLELYRRWPEFTYISGLAPGTTRAVTPCQPHLGAQYLLIDGRPIGDPKSALAGAHDSRLMGSCLADSVLHVHRPFELEFPAFLGLRSGRGFDASPTDGWSTVVWDLLGAGIRKAFNRRAAGYIDSPRYYGPRLPELDGYSIATKRGPAGSSTMTSVLGSDAADAFFAGAETAMESPGRDETATSVVLLETSDADHGKSAGA